MSPKRSREIHIRKLLAKSKKKEEHFCKVSWWPLLPEGENATSCHAYVGFVC